MPCPWWNVRNTICIWFICQTHPQRFQTQCFRKCINGNTLEIWILAYGKRSGHSIYIQMCCQLWIYQRVNLFNQFQRQIDIPKNEKNIYKSSSHINYPQRQLKNNNRNILRYEISNLIYFDWEEMTWMCKASALRTRERESALFIWANKFHPGVCPDNLESIQHSRICFVRV